MKKLIVMGLMLFVIVGCRPRVDTVNLVDGASKIKIFRKTDPPASCVEIRPFSAVSGSGCGMLGSPGSYEATYNTFRNTIVDMGGNAGLIENEVPSHPAPGCLVNAYVMNGVAYKCPEGVLTVK